LERHDEGHKGGGEPTHGKFPEKRKKVEKSGPDYGPFPWESIARPWRGHTKKPGRIGPGWSASARVKPNGPGCRRCPYPGRKRYRPDLPRCAAVGCTWRSGRSGTGSRS